MINKIFFKVDILLYIQCKCHKMFKSLFQLCLLSKCMKPALSFMEVDVTEISKEVSVSCARLKYELLLVLLLKYEWFLMLAFNPMVLNCALSS